MKERKKRRLTVVTESVSLADRVNKTGASQQQTSGVAGIHLVPGYLQEREESHSDKTDTDELNEWVGVGEKSASC